MTSAQVRRTPTRRADGGELIYFDDSEPYVSGGATRRLDDPRPLPDRFAPNAGVESGMAASISDTTPERIAARLQEVGRRPMFSGSVSGRAQKV